MPGAGLEPARLTAKAFKASAYASSATRAGHWCSRSRYRLEVDLAGVQGVRAGDPVQEQQPVEVVDLVLERARLEGIGGRARAPPRCRAPRRGRPAGSPASRHRSGRAPTGSPPGRAPTGVACSTSGLASTSGAVTGPRLGVAGHVEREHPQRPPRPAAPPARRSPATARWVASRSAARASTCGSSGSTSAEGVESTRGRRAHGGPHQRPAAARGAVTGCGSQHVGLEHPQRHLDAEVGADRGQVAAELLRVDGSGGRSTSASST